MAFSTLLFATLQLLLYSDTAFLVSACATTQTTSRASPNEVITPEPPRSISTTTGVLGYTIVDTGVIEFTTDSSIISPPRVGYDYYGQDATYSGNQPSYRDNGDGTISDLVTGLMWQKDTKKMFYSEAVQAVKSYSGGGHTDWRLPSIKELYSLILFTGNGNGMNAGSNPFLDSNYFIQPIGNISAGERPIDAQTLSQTTYKGRVFWNLVCNFGVNFIDGRIKCYPEFPPKQWYFRFVRGSTDYGKNNLKDNGDGTVSDLATSLMWQQDDSGDGMIWKDALSYCENLNLAGRSDWRLPNIKELQSIVDYTRSPQTTASPAIDPLFSVTDVDVPNGQIDYPYFWSGTTHKDGWVTPAAYIAFGQGWGMIRGEIIDVHGAGCQRSDPKSARGQTYPQYIGPQGDMRIVYNFARCVRNDG